MAKALGLGVTAWSPLAGGWLSGKYAAGARSGGRLDAGQMRDNFVQINDRTNATVAEVAAIAKEIGRSSAQVALAWLHHRDNPVIPIIGARKMDQLRDNLASAELKLSPDHLARLENASKIEMGFPHDFLNKDMVRSFAFGGMRDQIDLP